MNQAGSGPASLVTRERSSPDGASHSPSTHSPTRFWFVLLCALGLLAVLPVVFNLLKSPEHLATQFTPATMSAAAETPNKRTFVVVGGGLAGMSATLTLLHEVQELVNRANAGSSDSQIRLPREIQVMLVDKQPNLGGNSAKASSGINGVNSVSQRRWEQENHISEADADTIMSFLEDTLRSCVSTDEGVVGATTNVTRNQGVKHDAAEENVSPSERMKALVNVLVNDSAAAIRFLETLGGIGVEPGLSRIVQLGGHSHPRTHRLGANHPMEKMPIGVALTTSVMKVLKGLEEKFAAAAAEAQTTKEGSGTATRILFNIKTNTALAGITREGRKVTKVALKTMNGAGESPVTETVDCSALLIATGGFGANADLVSAYSPSLSHLHLPTTNGPWTTGEGMQLAARDGGATLVDMSEIQVHPTSFIDPASPLDRTRFLAPEALRGSGGLLFDDAGNRFVNELATRDYVSRHIQSVTSPAFAEAKSEHYPNSAFLILTQQAASTFGMPAIGFYKFKGFIHQVTAGEVKSQAAGNVALALALKMNEMRVKGGVKPKSAEEIKEVATHIADAIRAYTLGISAGRDAFGKSVFPNGQSFAGLLVDDAGKLPEDNQAVLAYVMIVAPAVHYTMGGIAIDADGRAMGWPEDHPNYAKQASGYAQSFSSFKDSSLAELQPIPGLYAAGEASGGLHGKNRLGGNSLLECVVFGRRSAKAMIQDQLA